jgi:hypothetical protein
MKTEKDYELLFEHLTSAINYATRLELNDLRFLLKMAILEATKRQCDLADAEKQTDPS